MIIATRAFQFAKLYFPASRVPAIITEHNKRDIILLHMSRLNKTESAVIYLSWMGEATDRKDSTYKC